MRCPLIPAHQICKDAVDGCQYLPAAPEISAQVNALTAALPMGIGLIFFQKKFRSGQAEFIDTLLHISHHETVIAALLLAGHRPEQIFLYQIAVLVFINEYLLKIFPVLPGHGTGPNLPLFLPQQYLQGIVLDIRKIHQLFSCFRARNACPNSMASSASICTGSRQASI